MISADGGDRTHTSGEGNWILSPARLPVPPHRLNCRDEWLTRFVRNATGENVRRRRHDVKGRCIRDDCAKHRQFSCRECPPAGSTTTHPPLFIDILPIDRNYFNRLSISQMAQLACSATSSSGSWVSFFNTDKSSFPPTFPNATHTFRTKRFRLIR